MAWRNAGVHKANVIDAIRLWGFEAEAWVVGGKRGRKGVDEPREDCKQQLKRSGRGRERAKNE
jgi:hypothetical protein